MSSKVKKTLPRGLIPALLLPLSFVLGISLYSMGWSGSWHFDDAPNLNNLLLVFANGPINWHAAQDFVLSGDAGPLGRPIALASFLIDGSTWPESPSALLYTNSLIHLLNALLLCGLLLSTLRLHGTAEHRAQLLAVIAASLWLTQPILVSGVLMAVQRMALLSSTFMLAGAWLYVAGRSRLEQTPVSGWIFMLFGLGGGTVLGVFSKEQAGLLPLLIWTLDSCLLPKPELNTNQQRLWRAFKVLAFYLPATFIALYLGKIVLNAEQAYAYRDFNLAERLWTQSVILWDYLRLTLLPRAPAFGPFHDDYPVYEIGLLPFIAVVAWLAIFFIAFKLRKKNRWPLFAITWFFLAHLVESTVVPLELYFEHRNYLAIVGPLLAACVLIATWASEHKKRLYIAIGGTVLYSVFLLFVLSQVTSLFGNNSVAAQIWHQQHPTSARAAQYLAGGLADSGDIPAALYVLDQQAEVNMHEASALHLQGLQLACVLNRSTSELEQRLGRALDSLSLANKRFSINDPLNKLKTIYDNQGCNEFLTRDMLISIAELALTNDKISGIAMERSNLNYYIATLHLDSRNLDKTMLHLEQAMQAVPQLVTLQLMVNILSSAGLHQESLQIMEEYPVKWPKNPWLRKTQQQTWNQIYNKLHSTLSSNI